MGDIKTKQGCTSHNTTTFVDPDEDWFSSAVQRLGGAANPSQQSTSTPHPSTNPFANNFYTQTPERQFNDFKQETTFVDCSYCLTLHKGPHCYRGTCDTLEAITTPGDQSTKTSTLGVCCNCGGRHQRRYLDEGVHSYSRAGDNVMCTLCQKVHEFPMCSKGTCMDLIPLPYICDVDHKSVDCLNPTCAFYKVNHARYQQGNPTRHICHLCGARHLTHKEPGTLLPTLECGYCRTRHSYPMCMVGSSCMNLKHLLTAFCTSEGVPISPPNTKHICETCNRRHAGHPSGSPGIHNSVSLVNCFPCGRSHPKPACYEGTCDATSAPVMSPKDPKIDTKFICNLCGKRHKISPQRIDQEFRMKVNEKVDCFSCSHYHSPGRCIAIKHCNAIDPRVNYSGRTPTRLPCPTCGFRHLNSSVLIKATNNINATSLSFPSSSFRAPCYETTIKQEKEEKGEEQEEERGKEKEEEEENKEGKKEKEEEKNINTELLKVRIRVLVNENKDPQPIEIPIKAAKLAVNQPVPRASTPRPTSRVNMMIPGRVPVFIPRSPSQTRKHPAKCFETNRQKVQTQSVYSPRSEYPTYKDWIRPQPMVYCPFCTHEHDEPVCKPELTDFDFCRRCNLTHVKPFCTSAKTHCKYPSYRNNYTVGQSAICRSCRSRHINRNDVAETLSFRHWKDSSDHTKTQQKLIQILEGEQFEGWYQRVNQYISSRNFAAFLFLVITSQSLRNLM